jgi:Histidine kinase-, DNA gyrase B-, and HSP90-like ATPase
MPSEYSPRQRRTPMPKSGKARSSRWRLTRSSRSRPRWRAIFPKVAATRRLTQVLLNLVGNAIKFTDSGEVVIKAGASKGSFNLSVRDTGPGISAADQAKLFQEFQQADNSVTRQKGGTGLLSPNASSKCTAARSGSNPRWVKARPFSSRFLSRRKNK